MLTDLFAPEKMRREITTFAVADTLLVILMINVITY
jgi:hypothetical protein